MSAASTMPAFPRVVFTILEPLSLFGGLFAAWLDTNNFITDQFYPVKSLLPHTESSRILAYQLGNLYCLMGLLGLAVLNLSHEQSVIRAYIVCLAIGDIGHLAGTIRVFGQHATFDVSNWNTLAWGNIGATVFLFITRVGWLLGLFGAPFVGAKGKGKKL